MADIKSIGSIGLKTAYNPLSAPQGGAYQLTNMIADLPGWATKRNGMKQLNATSSWTSALSQSGYTPKACWSFDDHIFVYADNGVYSAICAYSMVTSAGWHKVVEVSSILALDPSQFKMRSTACDRRQLITTSLGVKRIASIYGDYFPKDSTTNVNYSTMARDAGIPRALDPRCPNAVAASGTLPGLIVNTGYEWLLPSSSVAYEITWFKRDENAIPGIGAPSGRCVIRNTNTTTSYGVRLKVPIPAGVSDSSYVMQINRTTIVTADATGEIPDPGQDMFLAGEYRLTTTDLSNKYVLYEDISFDGILGADLYTNETQEGPLSARFQPPISRDIANFGGCAFYGNTTDKQRMIIKLLAVDSTGTAKGLRVGDMIVAGDLVMEGVARINEEGQNWYFAIDDTVNAGSEVIRCIKTAESFVYKYNIQSNAKNGRYYAYNVTGNNDIVGVIQLEEKSIGGSTGAFVGINRIDSPVQILPAPVFTSTPSNTLALACAVATNAGPTTVTVTAASNHSLTTGDLVFLAPFALSVESGASAPQLVNTDVPAGVYKITSTGATTFTFPSPAGAAAAQNDARTATTGGYFHKVFDFTSSVYTEARSDNNRKINRLYWSAPFEPECAPVINVVDVGSADKAILRLVPTQDSLFIFKEDGTWRLKGLAGDWEIIVLDAACVLAAPETPAVVDGRVFCYCTNGVFSVDDGGASRISSDIGGIVDNFYRSQALNPASAVSYTGVGHNESKSYWISFNSDVFRYNTPTKSWSRHFISAPDNVSAVATLSVAKASRYTTFDVQAYAERLVGVCSDVAGPVMVERRTGRIIDLCDADIPVGVSSFNTTDNTVKLTAVNAAIEVGDVFMWYANATYIPGGYSFSVASTGRFRATITAVNGDTLTLDIEDDVPILSIWPAISGARSGSILKQIKSYVSPMPIMIDSGLTLAHFNEVVFSMGSGGRFSTCSIGFNNETSPAIAGTEQATSAIDGFVYKTWQSVSILHSESAMPYVKTFRTGVPRTVATGSFLIVTFHNNRAMEWFDFAGMRLIYNAGDNKTRVTNA